MIIWPGLLFGLVIVAALAWALIVLVCVRRMRRIAAQLRGGG